MFVQCSLCGGENRYEPGQAMLACSFCGASPALDRPPKAERLILSHKRDDKMAEAMMRSYLAERERRRPTRVRIDFSFIPFSMIEADDGNIALAPASRAWRTSGLKPYPPAGEYRFLDEIAFKERVAAVDDADPAARRIVHLPLYAFAYETSGWRGHAAVIGESWQVIAEELPPERARRSSIGAVIAGLALFAGYYALARIVPGFIARFAAVAAVAATGYFIFALRERVKG